jgi:sterol desaturase/sphingolipid hydroxylase (fatty acid hydroxylase superfamily)
MERLISFFDHIQPWQRSLLLAGGLVFFWIREGFFPKFHFRYQKFRHAGLNLLFTFTTLLINLAFAFAILRVSQYGSTRHYGLLYWVRLPSWLFLLAGVLILDLVSAWFIHWLEHRVKWMWKFHLVHHADTWVDVTTANRHHPGESVLRAFFTLLAVWITGAPMWLVFFYQSISVLFAQFSHANISLPKWLDHALSWVIVSPDMHKVHHHYLLPLTDTNYGNIFSIWDRLLGTFVRVDDTRELQYGIDLIASEEENNRAGALMQIPFLPYRSPEGAKFSREDKAAGHP